MPITNYIPSSRLIQPGVCTSSTRPASPYNGMVIYETDTLKTYVYNGSSWVMQIAAGSPPGLELIKTQTLSSAVVYTDITSCFDANHTNYRVVISNLTAGSAQFIYFQLLNGSTPSNASYNYQYFTAQGSAMVAGQAASASYGIIAVAGVTKNSAVADIMNPYSTEYTTTIMNANYDGNTNQALVYQVNTTHTVSSSYNGLRIGSQAGNSISGATIRIYGYRDSI